MEIGTERCVVFLHILHYFYRSKRISNSASFASILSLQFLVSSFLISYFNGSYFELNYLNFTFFFRIFFLIFSSFLLSKGNSFVIREYRIIPKDQISQADVSYSPNQTSGAMQNIEPINWSIFYPGVYLIAHPKSISVTLIQ